MHFVHFNKFCVNIILRDPQSIYVKVIVWGMNGKYRIHVFFWIECTFSRN